MHKLKYCVYNTTRECYLSLGVTAADTTFTRLKGLIGKFRLRSDEGLWVIPSSGVHSLGVFFPIDVLYLDDHNRVIHLVESFPPFHIAPFKSQTNSVLELPTHSIYSSQTQVGDTLVICVAEQMEQELKFLANHPQLDEEETVPVAVRSTHHDSALNGIQQFPARIFAGSSPSERRQSNRQPTANLKAYFWTGATPKAHEVRDVSPTGLYLKTEERWYPGTVVTMTLQRTDVPEESTERTITVQSKAVRSDADGVGLEFVLPEGKDGLETKNDFGKAANKKKLHRFLRFFDRRNGSAN